MAAEERLVVGHVLQRDYSLAWFVLQDPIKKCERIGVGKTVENLGDADLSHRIASRSHRLGEISAPVLLVEYFSYTCPHCATYEALIEPQLIETFVDAGKVLMVARHRPFGSDAINGSRVAIAAAQQDPAAFWPMHSLLFERIGPMAENGYDWEDFGPLGEELGLDGELLVSAAQSDAASNLLQANLAEAGNLDVNATPTFFINGERKIGAGSLDEFISELNSAVAAAT